MNKRNKIICIVLAAIVLIFIGYNYYVDNFAIRQIRWEPIDEPIREPKPIERDKNFVDNQVLIMFEDNVTEEEKNNFFNSLPDLLNYNHIGGTSYAVTLNRTFETRNELGNYCRSLTKNIFIKVCEANNIIRLDDCDKGPC